MPYPQHVPFVNDTVLIMERGMSGATGNWYCGLHEVADMAFVLHALRAGDLFADVGANIGSFTVLASGGVGARSICLEPIASTFARLQRNIVCNGIDARTMAYNVGAGSKAEQLRFTADSDTTNRAIDGEYLGETVEVSVHRLDDLLQGEVPFLVKIDVEGFEAEVLKGMSGFLSDPSLKSIITENNASGSESVSAIMADHGFEAYSYDPFQRKLNLGGTGQNTIFIRDIVTLQDRVTTAPQFSLVNGAI